MSTYGSITLSSSTFNELIYYLERIAEKQYKYDEMENIVFLIQHLQEEWDEDMSKQNEETKRWIKQQKILAKDDKDIPHIFLYHRLVSCLRENNIDISEYDEPYFIMDLMDIAENYFKNDSTSMEEYFYEKFRNEKGNEQIGVDNCD